MKDVAVFGSTGSIGTSTLNVIRENEELFNVNILVARKSVDKLIEQIEEFKPKYVYIESEKDASTLKAKFPNVEVYYGASGMQEISEISDYDIVVSALVGVAGLSPTYNAIKNGKQIALANKEVLVTGGNLIIEASKKYCAKLLTVDSEHSAIMQCLNGEEGNRIDKILLTCSGGPFFDKVITDTITAHDALQHPTWNMGAKITIDSSTLMNKGLEVIEAKYLFDVSEDDIEVVIHRKSIVHSMVQFEDGSIAASLGPKNMEIPIAYALNFPNRLKNNIEKLNLFDVRELTFERPDVNKFKCLKLAYEAIKRGHSHQIVLNAANEVLVDKFLKNEIKFMDIPNGVERMLDKHNGIEINSVEDVLELDNEVRNSMSKI